MAAVDGLPLVTVLAGLSPDAGTLDALGDVNDDRLRPVLV